jgi:predicted nucleic acid-binding protein
MINRKWALDTNVLIDLADEIDSAHTFREIAIERGYSLFAPLQVILEIAHLAKGEKHPSALRALRSLRAWKIDPFDPPSHARHIATEFSRELQWRQMIATGEFNDGVILAESSLCGAALLVTSDKHLLDIDPTQLRLLFEEKDLAPVIVVSPTELTKRLDPNRGSSSKY